MKILLSLFLVLFITIKLTSLTGKEPNDDGINVHQEIPTIYIFEVKIKFTDELPRKILAALSEEDLKEIEFRGPDDVLVDANVAMQKKIDEQAGLRSRFYEFSEFHKKRALVLVILDQVGKGDESVAGSITVFPVTSRKEHETIKDLLEKLSKQGNIANLEHVTGKK
jgi:hypothetical protein